MSVLFVAAGDKTFGSSRMRAWWVAERMGAQAVKWDGGGAMPIADTYIFQKTLNGQLAADLRKMGKRVWWDVCDPSWWFQPQECADIVRHIDGVVASNEPLLKDFLRWVQDVPIDHEIQAHVIGDRLDIGHFPKTRQHQRVQTVRLIWYGVAANRVSLHAAIPTLERLACNGQQFAVTIMDNEPNHPWRISERFDTYHLQWTLARENAVLSSHDIALLPPYPGKWGQIKSNNKTVTAWANGLPVTQGIEYYELEALMNWHTRREAGNNGRATVHEHYDVAQSAAEWEALLCAS